MKRSFPSPSLVLLATALVVPGCATVRTHGVEDPDSTPQGVRIYAPRTFFMVDGRVQPPQTLVLTLPDPCRAYDVEPLTLFSKQDFKVELGEDSTLKALTANQDTAAFLTFAKDAATLASKAAGLPVSQGLVNGTFGLPDGVYSFDDAGRLALVHGADSLPGAARGACP